MTRNHPNLTSLLKRAAQCFQEFLASSLFPPAQAEIPRTLGTEQTYKSEGERRIVGVGTLAERGNKLAIFVPSLSCSLIFVVFNNINHVASNPTCKLKFNHNGCSEGQNIGFRVLLYIEKIIRK